MSNKRERRREQTLDLLQAWTGIGVFGRLVFALAIIAGAGWLVFQLIGIVALATLTLRGF